MPRSGRVLAILAAIALLLVILGAVGLFGVLRTSRLVDGAGAAVGGLATVRLILALVVVAALAGVLIAGVVVRRSSFALDASELRYRSIAEDLPSLLCRFLPDTTITYVNDAYATYFGRSVDQLLGRSFLELVPAEHHEELRRHLAELTAARPTRIVVHEVVGPDGAVRWQEWVDRALFDEQGVPVEYQSVGRDVTEQREMEVRQGLLLRELDHRVKNNLAAVLSLAEQTLRSSASDEDFLERYRGRVHAIARAHEMLASAKWIGVDVTEAVDRALAPFVPTPSDRVAVSGPPIRLEPRMAAPFAMVLHELATNAAKHGALGAPGGSLHVTWGVPGGTRLELRWRERTGDRPVAPFIPGGGYGLIEGLVNHELKGAINTSFGRDGLEVTVDMPLGSGGRVPVPEERRVIA